MAKGNFSAVLGVTLPHEGGWADHPSDPGGATMKGITLATFRKYFPNATKTDLRAISNEDVQQIYRDGYWLPIKGDALPAGLDLSVFDYGVNSGPSRSVKDLQRVLGIGADGAVGPQTLAMSSSSDVKKTIQAHCARRLSFVRGLGTFSVFGKGWSKRIADVEAKAVAMWLKAAGATGHAQTGTLAKESKTACEKSVKQRGAATGTATGGAGYAGGDVALTGDPNLTIIFIVLAIAGIAALGFYLKSRQNKDRADAYMQVARDV